MRGKEIFLSGIWTVETKCLLRFGGKTLPVKSPGRREFAYSQNTTSSERAPGLDAAERRPEEKARMESHRSPSHGKLQPLPLPGDSVPRDWHTCTSLTHAAAACRTDYSGC